MPNCESQAWVVAWISVTSPISPPLTMWANFLGPGDAISGSALARLLLDSFPVVLTLLPAEFDSVRSFFGQ